MFPLLFTSETHDVATVMATQQKNVLKKNKIWCKSFN
jgi:hypothetical protein